ncbi:hypothetical protein GGR56DRAFT_161183 [Xylariaceae sp. FL0804]|nr:hypothetical protein GGR56DRAFT_161183 [Xylariaceae sp. FL0804]
MTREDRRNYGPSMSQTFGGQTVRASFPSPSAEEPLFSYSIITGTASPSDGIVCRFPHWTSFAHWTIGHSRQEVPSSRQHSTDMAPGAGINVQDCTIHNSVSFGGGPSVAAGAPAAAAGGKTTKQQTPRRARGRTPAQKAKANMKKKTRRIQRAIVRQDDYANGRGPPSPCPHCHGNHWAVDCDAANSGRQQQKGSRKRDATTAGLDDDEVIELSDDSGTGHDGDDGDDDADDEQSNSFAGSGPNQQQQQQPRRDPTPAQGFRFANQGPGAAAHPNKDLIVLHNVPLGIAEFIPADAGRAAVPLQTLVRAMVDLYVEVERVAREPERRRTTRERVLRWDRIVRLLMERYDGELRRKLALLLILDQEEVELP